MIEYIAVGATYNKIFTTNSAAGAAVAPSGAFGTDDVVIYKDNSATQRSSTSGWTVTSPFDSVTGQHLFSADLSDNTDAGFYASGHKYTVMLVPNETVDSQTVVAVIGEFIIGPVDANLISILGSAISGTAAQISAAFTKFFDKATPTGTINSLPDAAPGAANGVLTQGTGTGQINASGGKVTTTYTIVKNQAFSAFEFEMVLSSDHVSPATGKTVTVQRSIDGGAYGNSTNAAAEVGSGTYKVDLSAADLNGNMITLKMTAAGCDTTKIGIVTQS